MDISLWAEFNEKVVLPCYTNISKKAHKCKFTNNVISGTLVFKTDAGPGCLSKETKSVDFQEKIHERGLVILFRLPNGTADAQEMEKAYRDLKQ